MSTQKTILVDGYNVINKIPALRHVARKSLEKSRRALASFLRDWKIANNLRATISIVFDGQEGLFIDDCQSFAGIQFVFSHSGEDADARIIAMIQSSHAPQATTVISDDTYIRNHCKVYGAQIKPVSSLIARAPQISGACKKTKSSAHLQSKKISPAAKNSINQFLKKEWGIE